MSDSSVRSILPEKMTDRDFIVGTNKLPAYSDIPDDFKRQHNKWAEIHDAMYFCGIEIKKQKCRYEHMLCMRHIAAINANWEIKHEHKRAAVAYLLSLWYEKFEYERVKS